MPDYENVLYQQDGPVVTITWNRPETLNAITPALEDEFHLALDEANADPSARAIIVTGAGRAFSSGYNIDGGIDSAVGGPRTPVSGHLRRWHHFSSRNPDMMMHLMTLETPIIAAVNGWCIGGGFWYALACDITIASDRAVFAQPEVRMVSNSSVLFAILAGWKVAHRYALTGDHFDAEEALRIGVINEIAPAEDLMDRSHALAERLARVPSDSIRYNKLITARGLEAMGLRNALNVGALLSTIVEASADGPEVEHLDEARRDGGFGAFLRARDDPFRPEPFGPRSTH